MHDAFTLPSLITDTINEFVDSKRKDLQDLGGEIEPVLNEIQNFLQGGKRLRGQFLMTGFQTVHKLNSENKKDKVLVAVLKAAASLEIFHAAALVHDDIIDRSATRRGKPSLHEKFRKYHQQNGLSYDAEHFGLSTALLVGDLLQSWADEIMDEALTMLDSPEHSKNARSIFNRMRSEVAAGQYLDVLEEMRSNFAEHDLQIERSTRVLIYKSAKYSVQAPLLLGAAMAGSSEADLKHLADFGLPIGVAFQLRDDILGVFGEEALTGKPIGDDLREGKKTVLVALARKDLVTGAKKLFDELHGNSDLTQDQVKILQATIEDSGARSAVEKMIAKNVGLARQALEDSKVSAESRKMLLQLAELAAQRSF